MMRNIFLDIGSHTGQSVHRFYEQIKDAADWHIFCFEPLFISRLKHSVSDYSNVTCIKAVVGDRGGSIEIFPVPDGGQGATTQKGKTTGGILYGKGVKVACIDIVCWFDSFIQQDDFVIVKINIEGGEYALMPILPKILPKIAGIVIKLHLNKFKQKEMRKMLDVFEKFLLTNDEDNNVIILDQTEGLYDFKYLVEQARRAKYSQ